MCGVLASDAGLWNLAWLTYAKPFKTYEDASVPQSHKPVLMPSGHEHIALIGKTQVDGKTLRSLAATLTAPQLIDAIRQATTLVPSLGPEAWRKWLAFAKFRATQSHDVKCAAEVFKQPDELAKAAREDIEIQAKLPEPPLPVFTTRQPGQVIDFQAWLDRLKGGTVH